MDLRHLRSVLAVADERHFSRAAERLRVAQPSLSRQVREVEAELGVELFRRTSRRVELTSAGLAFVAAAEEALRAVERSSEAARAAATGTEGAVTLGLVASAAIEILPDLVQRMHNELPGVSLTLREMGSEQQAQALLARDIDAGLARDLTPRPGLVITPLLREPLLAAVPEALVLSGVSDSALLAGASGSLPPAEAVALAELLHLEVVSLPPGASPRATQLLESVALHENAQVRWGQEAHQYATLLALVAAEVGFAVVPASVCSLRSNGVRYLRLRDDGAWSEVQALTREGHDHPAANQLVRVLIVGAELLVRVAGGPGQKE